MAPSESTIRRVLQRVDAEQLDLAVCSWLAAQLPGAPDGASDGVQVIAVDGKSARGARCRSEPGGRAVHLLAAFDTTSGAVLGQGGVDGKTNEISAFAPLLDRVDITGAIVTADALQTQRAQVDYLTGRGAHYLSGRACLWGSSPCSCWRRSQPSPSLSPRRTPPWSYSSSPPLSRPCGARTPSTASILRDPHAERTLGAPCAAVTGPVPRPGSYFAT